LSESEAKALTILNSLSEGVLFLNSNGVVENINPCAERILGYSLRELKDPALDLAGKLLRSDGTLFPVEDQPAIRALRTGRDVHNDEMGVPRRDGTLAWISVNSEVMRNSSGNVLGAVSSFHDITERKRAESALRASEERFRSLIMATTQIVWTTNAEGNAEADIPTWRAFTGQTLEEMRGAGWNSALHPDDRARTMAVWQRAVASKSLYDCEFRVRRHDGAYRHLAVRGVPVLNTDGSLREWIGACTDITERMSAEEHRRKEAERNHLLLQLYEKAALLTDKELYDYSLGQAVRLTDSSIGFFHLLSEDQQTVNLTTWFGEAMKSCTTSPKGQYPIAQAGNWLDCARLKQPVIYNDYPSSPNRKGLPAGHVPVHRFMSIPVLEGDKVRIIFGVGNKTANYEDQDVVQLQLVANELFKILLQRQADLALRASELKFRRLNESMMDAFVIVDMADHLQEFNGAFQAMLGYSVEELHHLTFSDLIPQKWHTYRAKIIAEQILPRGYSDVVELEHRRKDGTEFPVEVRAFLIKDDAGQPAFMWAIIRDITERKRLEEQLRQSQKMDAFGKLAGGVAHDFNNLLVIINGYSELILNGMALTAEKQRECLREIRKAGDRAASLTRQLLAFSRKQLLQPVVLDLNHLISEMEKMLRRLIHEDIGLKLLLDPALGQVKADPGQIEQVIMNLVINARDAMPTGGHLTIETKNIGLDQEYARKHVDVQPGEYAMLAVADTGCGMDEVTMSRIFEPFFTTKEVGKGTGLGLATVHGIVKQSGGTVEVYSEVGLGTTFKIYLPRIMEQVSSHTPVPAHSLMPRGTETILLAEDEEEVRVTIRLALESQGYTVLIARNGEEALQIFQKHRGPIHLLVSDLVMPKMSGHQLAERLVSLQPNIKILYISGYADDTIVRHGVLETDTAFVQKPFSLTILARKVREVLDQQRVPK
jgi:PAS domain S-box-containing protein